LDHDWNWSHYTRVSPDYIPGSSGFHLCYTTPLTKQTAPIYVRR
jgi:hypothetical protein